MIIIPIEQKVFIEVTAILDLLTAEEARKIATSWQSNHVSGYVNNALKAVQERARAGFFNTYVSDPSPSQVNLTECIRAMETLGYTIDTKTAGGIWWKW